MQGRNITKIVRNMMLYKNKFQTMDLNDNEYELVRYITKHKDGLSQSDLAFYLNVDKALITRMVKKLADLEYIEISNSLSDSRKKIIKPLDKAFLLKDIVSNEEVSYYKLITSVLTKEEDLMLDKLIEKIYLESKRLRKLKFPGNTNE